MNAIVYRVLISHWWVGTGTSSKHMMSDGHVQLRVISVW